MGKKNATQTRPKPAEPTAPEQEAEKTQEQAPESTPEQGTGQTTEETSEQKQEQASNEAPGQVPESAKPQGKKGSKLPDFLTPYLKAKQKNRVFHATTDRMVFPEADLDMARAHQIGLGGGEVKTYKVK